MARKEIRVFADKVTDPLTNLDEEDRIFGRVERRETPEALRFWKNSECLIRGKVRNPRYGWYNEELAAKLRVPVVQRSTGGGVVYNDLGNLNWSFYFESNGEPLSPEALFRKASVYVVDALRQGGFDARFSPPNRIDVGGRKVSGLAARSTRAAHLVHGTLLVNSNLVRLNRLCISPPGCPPVSNLIEWLPEVTDEVLEQAFMERLIKSGYAVAIAEEL